MSIDIDAISLEQALLDVEVANARVIDLTRRLMIMNREMVDLRMRLARSEAQASRIDSNWVARELFEARAEVEALRITHRGEIAALQARLDKAEQPVVRPLAAASAKPAPAAPAVAPPAAAAPPVAAPPAAAPPAAAAPGRR